jgi:glutamate--cysteine ligase
MENGYTKKITAYLRSAEKHADNLRLGLEVEHFILWETSRTGVTYSGDRGIRELLHWFEWQGWEGCYEEGRLLGLSRGRQTITLEPGAQVEFSSSPALEIDTLAGEYNQFLKNLRVWTGRNGQIVENRGYQPVSSISDLPLIPKRKYHEMDRYFRGRGEYARHMMRGTGSTQVTVDYMNEADFLRKLRLAARCTPVFALLFSNCSSFEGLPYNGYSLRTEIWNSCDDDRCGILPGIFDDDFGYERFAEYLLALKPIVHYLDGKYIPAREYTFRDMLEQYPPVNFEATLAEMLRMVFTDVRVKQFLEFRMVDSLPPEEIWMYASLVKSIFYQPENLAQAELLFDGIGACDIAAAMTEMPEKGYRTVFGDLELSEYVFRLTDIANNNPFPDTAGHLEQLRRGLCKRTCGKAVCA